MMETPTVSEIILMLLLRRGPQSYTQLRGSLPNVSHTAIRMAVYYLRRRNRIRVEYGNGGHAWAIPPCHCPLCGHAVDGGEA